jgi:hypothetical protein
MTTTDDGAPADLRPADPPRRIGYLDVLAVGEFRAVFAAHVLTMVGSVVAQAALSIVIYQRTRSPLLSALTFAFSFLPYLLGGTLLSSVADRFPSRRVLVACDLTSFVLVAAMATPGLPIAALLALQLGVGTVAPIFNGTRSASLAEILAGPGYVLGRSALRLVSQGAQVGGFAVAGLLLLVMPAQAVLLADAATLLASAALLRFGTRRRPARGGGPRRSLVLDSLAGLRAVMGRPRLRALLLFGWLAPAFTIAPEALAAPYVVDLTGSPARVGVLLAAIPAGMVVGEPLAARFLPPATRARLIVPLAAGAMLPLLGFALRPPVPVAAGLLAVTGACYAYALGLDHLVLEATPESLLGRVLTVQTSGLMVSQGAAFAIAGAAAEVAAPHAVVAASAVAGLVVIGLLARGLSGRRAVHEQDVAGAELPDP